MITKTISRESSTGGLPSLVQGAVRKLWTTKLTRPSLSAPARTVPWFGFPRQTRG